MKKCSIFVISGVIGLMVLSGCTTPDGGMSVDEIKTNIIQAADEINSYVYTMNSVVSTTMGEVGETMVTQTGSGSSDIVNQNVMTESITPGNGGMSDTTTLTYVIDSVVYTGTETGGNTTWTKANLTEWNQYDMVYSQTELLSMSGLKKLNDQTVEGVDCYVIELNPDLTDPTSLPPEFESVASMLSDFTIKQWVVKDNFYPKKIQMIMEINMFGMVMNTDSTIIFSNINEPVTIELPEGAESADWATDYGF